MQEQTENTSKRSGFLTIILVFIGLVIFGAILGIFASRRDINKNQQNKQESAITTQKGKIDVNRDVLINTFKDKNYIFKKDKPIDNQENYVAKYGKGEIQVLGNKENLSSTSFTAYMGFDSNGTVDGAVTALTEMLLFASTINKSCGEWLAKHQLEATNNINQIYNKSEIACGRNLTLIYFPSDNMTFGVNPANE